MKETPKHLKILIGSFVISVPIVYFSPIDWMPYTIIPFFIIGFYLMISLVRLDNRERYERHIARMREEMRKVIQEEKDRK